MSDIQLMTAKEVCAMLKIGSNKLYELRKFGRIKAIKFGYGTVRYKRSDIVRLIEENGEEIKAPSTKEIREMMMPTKLNF